MVAPTDRSLTPLASRLLAAGDSASARAAIDAVGSDDTIETASKLATGREIALTGAASGSTTFDGSADVEIDVTLAAPTSSVRGGVLRGVAIADLTAAPTMADFNNLLAVLRAAGVIAPS